VRRESCPKGLEKDMDSKEIIRMGLTASWDGLRKALSGLTAAERRFQPDRHANHMEMATTFAVAEYFGMARAAILDVFDNEHSA